jgi:mRNA interferase MazF
MVRGEIYFVDLAPRSGSEQTGRRPCIVVSHNTFSSNPGWQSITVVPMTSSERWQRPSPTTVLFPAGEANLPRSSAALIHQLTTIDKSKTVGAAVGQLSAQKMAEVESALRNYLVL